MSVLHRFLCLFLAVQLFLLGTLPLVASNSKAEHSVPTISNVSIFRVDGEIPGQPGDIGKEGQAEVAEDETEEIDPFDEADSNAAITAYLPAFRIGTCKKEFYQLLPSAGPALFILFHCWKLDFFID